MEIQNQIDVQCRKIADGLANLKEALSQPLARKVLELDTSLESGRNSDQLIRLERSLLQYLERKGDLLYVGLMGHFSSGKSSTINSLLGLWNSEGARAVDLNPTDKAITLITDPANSKALIGLKKEGSIPVRTDFVKHDLLKNIVVADTPGSGDPLLVNEMVRDFLPVCDIILYFLSAATPLTEADTPMLKAKTKELRFIPMKFVVTRGDEFRRDKSIPVSEINFQREQFDQFINQILVRIGKVLGAELDKNQDFMVIDNRSHYNINQLTEFLLAQSDIQDSSKRIAMHGHKVDYFISYSHQIQSYFGSLIAQKAEVLRRIVEQARANIARYQDKVQITNNKLTESWIKNHSSMDELRSDLIRKLSDSKQGLILEENPLDDEKLRPWKGMIVREIDSSSRQHLSEIVRQLEVRAVQILSSSFQDLKKTLHETDIDNLKISELEHFRGVDVDIEVKSLNLNLPFTLRKQLEECPEILNAIVRDNYSAVSTGLNSLHSRLVALQPLEDLQKIVHRSIESLEDDIKAYFDNVHVYRSGVFALQVRESIGKLGIESELDEIESEFQDDFKEKIMIDAKSQIFPQANILIPKYGLKLKEILEECKQQREIVRSYELKHERTAIPAPVSTYDQESWASVLKEYGKSVNEHLGLILRKTYTNLGNTLGEYYSSLRTLAIGRKKRLRTVTLTTGGVVLMAYLIYRFFNYVPEQTLTLIVVTGVVSNLLGDLIGYGIGKFTDKSRDRIVSLQKGFERRLFIECDKIMDIELQAFRLTDLNSDSIMEFIRRTWTNQMQAFTTEILGSRLSIDHKQVRGFVQQYSELVNKYSAIGDEMSKGLMSYFRNIDSNLSKLQNISRSISTVAIEPSFKLLDKTHQDLQGVSETIAKTTFS